MPTPSRTGTASQVDGSGGNGSTSVSVPSDCNLVVAFWSLFGAGNMSSLTLNSVGFTIQSQLSSSGGSSGCGVATLVSPATGTQTFAWTWSSPPPSEGGKITLVYVKDANTSDAVRDAKTAQNPGAPVTVTVTPTSQATDLVLGQGEDDNGPSTTATVFINDALLNGSFYDLTEVTAGSPTTTVSVTNGSAPTVAAISLKQSVAAGFVTGHLQQGSVITRTRQFDVGG